MDAYEGSSEQSRCESVTTNSSALLRSRNAPNPRKGVSRARPSNGDPSTWNCTGISRLALKPRRSVLRSLKRVSSLQTGSFRAHLSNESRAPCPQPWWAAPQLPPLYFGPAIDFGPASHFYPALYFVPPYTLALLHTLTPPPSHTFTPPDTLAPPSEKLEKRHGVDISSGEMRHWKWRSPERWRIYNENIILCFMLMNLLSDII